MTEEYLGDGLYASFEGWQVKLRAPREHGDHEVYLDGSLLRNFLAWMKENRIFITDGVMPPNAGEGEV